MNSYRQGVILGLLEDLWKLFPNKSFSQLMSTLEYRLEDYDDDKLEEALKELLLQNM